MSRRKPDEIKESSACLILLLLLERQRLIEKNSYKESDDRHLKELCSVLLWKHSEAHGKYNGCPYWSKSALESKTKHKKVITSISKIQEDALRHEHLFPRAELVMHLFTLKSPKVEEIKIILEKLNIGVIVTVAEDNRLSKKGNFENPWQRYKDAEIEMEMETNSKT